MSSYDLRMEILREDPVYLVDQMKYLPVAMTVASHRQPMEDRSEKRVHLHMGPVGGFATDPWIPFWSWFLVFSAWSIGVLKAGHVSAPLQAISCCDLRMEAWRQVLVYLVHQMEYLPVLVTVAPHRQPSEDRSENRVLLRMGPVEGFAMDPWIPFWSWFRMFFA